MLCSLLAQGVVGVVYGVEYLKVSVVVCLSVDVDNDVVVVGRGAFPDEGYVLFVSLWQCGVVVGVADKLWQLLLQLCDAYFLFSAGYGIVGMQGELHHVACLHLRFVGLLMVVARQGVVNAFVGIERCGYKEEDEQYERDVGCSRGVESGYLFALHVG